MGTYRVTYEINFNGSIGTNVRFIDAADEQDAEKYFFDKYQSKKASIGKVVAVELLDNDTQH